MTPEQQVAYVNSQTAAMLATLEAMRVANVERSMLGHSPAYDEEAFYNLPAEFGITHNQVLGLWL